MKDAELEVCLRRLIKLKAPKVFILLILATSWLCLEPPDAEIQVLELFAGRARLARLAKSLGIPAHAHDVTFDPASKKKVENRQWISMNLVATCFPANHFAALWCFKMT
ncbi:unnamed protein product [Cladocopium goreaui]|uniref:Uncharacterized protein n=1 Tax=Cladocopium goreaui TaxID=2562237 RepID=A0A9P1DBC4_9DINO|nr:unnamed protein product [Cladocopium goreaui]